MNAKAKALQPSAPTKGKKRPRASRPDHRVKGPEKSSQPRPMAQSRPMIHTCTSPRQ